MNKRAIALFFILFIPAPSPAGLHDPFPMGHSMTHFGTVVRHRGIGGRQPWNPSCFYHDSLRFGLSTATAWYYDPMDNLKETSINQLILGGFYDYSFVTVKASFAHLSALDLYFEQTGFLSLGTDALKYVLISFELCGYHIGLSHEDESEKMLYAGESFWIPWKLVGLSVTRKNIRLDGASEPGFRPPTLWQIGIHTKKTQAGALGVLIELTEEKNPEFRLYIGEEYWFHNNFALGIGIATRPFMISAGFAVNIVSANAYASMVNHPVLGWSKGFGIEWSK
ncbi:MAG: hypothetical protein GF350_02555 [Chitinivibrionales bacterium]|nr:hypothetical protein [Chitinivibrionales bacterium]